MENVLRAAIMYVFLFIIFKISGRKTLLEMTIFDFILVLIISEATQQALLGEDFSITGAMITIGTLIFIDKGLGILENKIPKLDLWLNGSPIILIENGKVLDQRLRKCSLSEDEILVVARQQEGIVNLNEIKFAILENNGKISIIPYKE
ncbi:DUF421 domain-containing protein [Rahnella sp. C60]|uniref:DUF421 domain-containing protein n=1 Tax=Rahnella perminowiae TaxID=2816244 RepID=A0ABS6L502_9GAMM|nr:MULTISPECIES: YetF domain-containing protein [Rahnella]UJD91804.1 DUF421 domain-containing protein [Rahnella aquatilis]MBU9811152.1 DUF421 domain-containing protein [Rahnella perminowiae]MBU9816250.1 DUF421 domain-containing protein [Rahnella perminowiae]MBU9827378.1 DUF421 domain-containing protein [Rahnella perminowiae]MBU9836522.1 DUF421 domain-containing protein [Rahnella perminowiae]